MQFVSFWVSEIFIPHKINHEKLKKTINSTHTYIFFYPRVHNIFFIKTKEFIFRNIWLCATGNMIGIADLALNISVLLLLCPADNLNQIKSANSSSSNLIIQRFFPFLRKSTGHLGSGLVNNANFFAFYMNYCSPIFSSWLAHYLSCTFVFKSRYLGIGIYSWFSYHGEGLVTPSSFKSYGLL